MTGRGALFALTADRAARLAGARDDREVLRLLAAAVERAQVEEVRPQVAEVLLTERTPAERPRGLGRRLQADETARSQAASKGSSAAATSRTSCTSVRAAR